MSLRKAMWRTFTVPFLLIFCASELLGATSLSGLGTVVRPSSPYDPAQPFVVYVPGEVLHRVSTLEQIGSGGQFVRSSPQLLLGESDQLGVFPHLPNVPVDPRLGITAVQDFSVRWAKPFREGLFGGDFYLGFKKALMRRLHDNHIYIVTALHALGALAQANPDQFFRGFGFFDQKGLFQATARMPTEMNDPFRPGQTISPQDLLSSAMTRVRETHDVLTSVLVMPPASIDPDLMLHWLDSVNLGPRYADVGEREPLVADETTLNEQIQNYCALTYVPWLVKNNVREGLADEPEAHEGVLSKAMVDFGLRGLRSQISLPGHAQMTPGTLAQLRLQNIALDPHPDPESQKLKYRWAQYGYALPPGSGLRLFMEAVVPLVKSVDVTLSNGSRLDQSFQAIEFTQLSYEFLKAHLQKLLYLQTAFGHLRQHPVSADDIWALVMHYTQQNLQDAERYQLRDFNATYRSLFHTAERAQFTAVQRFGGKAQIKRIVAASEGLPISNAGEELSAQEGQKYVRLWIEQSSYTMCQALAYQNFYEKYLMAQQNAGFKIPQVSPNHDVWEAISSPELAAFFQKTEDAARQAQALTQATELFSPQSLFPGMKGWGYFYDILVRFGHLPRATQGPVPYVLGSATSNHTELFIPGLIHSPTKMWWDLFLNLIQMPLDLTLLPEFQPEQPAGSSPKTAWLYQEGGYQSFETVLNVTQSTSEYLNYQFRASAFDELKEVALYLFRNRIGFTPQEQYLFLTSYFKEYLLPLAYLFQFFTPNVFSDPKLSELIGFEVPKGAISDDLVQMLQQGSSNEFVVKNSLPKDAWAFEVRPQDKNLHISFLDPLLAAFKKPLPVEDATPYGRLEQAIAKLNHYIDQRVRWCWATPRHTFPLRDNLDQIVSGLKTEGNEEPITQIRARQDSTSPYLYPRTTQGNQPRETFPVAGVIPEDASPEERDLWLNLLCSFPTFIRYYFEGYLELAQRYQQAMQIFRHIELFQRKRIMDTAHLTYLEGLPERAVFQLDYAMADDRDRQEGQLNRTAYAQEVSRYLREKQAYITTFDNVQSMLDGAFKADYTTSDYVHALEQVYLGISPITGVSDQVLQSIGAAVYNAVAQAYDSGVLKFETLEERQDQEQAVLKKFKDDSTEEVQEARKLTQNWWREVHDKFINPLVDHYVPAHKKLTKHDYECRQENNLTELHLVYQNKLACSLQRQIVYKVMLQKTLVKYRKAMKAFLDIDGVAQDETDPFVRILRWAALKFEHMFTDKNLGDLGKQLEEMTRPQQPEQAMPLSLFGMAQNPSLMGAMGELAPDETPESKPESEDLTWEDALGEVERVQVDVVGGFLRDLVGVIQHFRPQQTAEQEAVMVYGEVLKRYRQAVKHVFQEPTATILDAPTRFYEQSVNHLRPVYWFFGPNVLFENPNYVPKHRHFAEIRKYFDDFYRMIPLSGDRSIPGLSFNERQDPTGMSFSRSAQNAPEDRRAMIELLRHFDLQLLKYGVNNLLNAKLLLGDEEALQPVSKDLYDQLGSLGEKDVVHEQFLGTADVYGEVAPFEMLLFIYNRSSPAWKAWRSFVSNVSVLNFFVPELGISTPVGPRYGARAYGSEDWVGMNALMGRVGKMLGWSERNSNWHLLMHRGFCHIGARLQGGSLVQDLIQSRTFEWEGVPDLKSVAWNVFQVFQPPEVPLTVISRQDEAATQLRTQDVVNFREEFENWYCDVYSIDRGHPPTGAFTLAERDTLNVVDQRIAAAKAELQDSDFRQGAQELKDVQGSKMFEGAMLWTFLDMLNAYVIEPYMKSGFALQELFAELDLTLRGHLGYFVNENQQSTLPWWLDWPGLSYARKRWVTGETIELGPRLASFFNKMAELKGRGMWAAAANDGVLMDFLTRVRDPHGTLKSRDTYPDLQKRLLEVFHLNYVKDSPQEIEGVVDVPGYIDGSDGVVKFLHGGEAHRFLEEDYTQRLPGGQYHGGLVSGVLSWLPRKAFATLPDYWRYLSGLMKGFREGGEACITEIGQVRETWLPEGKLSQGEFEVLSSQDQKNYLANVEMVNALEQYGLYLETQYVKTGDVNERLQRPGFCFLKRLAFNTAYQLLLSKRDVEKEAQEAWEKYTHPQTSGTVSSADLLPTPCVQLAETYRDNLKWSVGKNTVETFEAIKDGNDLNQAYCHHILYGFKVADGYRKISGYGSDLPKEDSLQRRESKSQSPTAAGMAGMGSPSELPGQEPPPLRQPFGALNLLVVYQDGLNELEQWRNLMVQNVALQYPQLDAQVGREEAMGQVLAGQTQDRPFIKRAYVEIVRKHAPQVFVAMQNLVQQFSRHSGPLCEFFNASLLSQSGSEGHENSRQELFNTPQVQKLMSAKLAGHTYVLGSHLCRSAEGISNFALTRWAYRDPDHLDTQLDEARGMAIDAVKRRYEAMLDVFLEVFPWMADVTLMGGQQPVNFHAWLANFGAEGPATALYQWIQAHPDNPLAAGVHGFVRDETPLVGYSGVLRASIHQNIDLIAQQYHVSHNVIRRSTEFDLERLKGLSGKAREEEEAKFEAMDRATLFQLLTQRFSIPKLYDQVRAEVGPRYDKFYYYFVPVQVWNQFKRFEEYQSVVGTFTGAMFVMQMLISMTPLTMFFRNLMGKAIRAGMHVGGTLGAVTGFLMVSSAAILMSYTVGAWLAYRVFNIFGANWRPIKLAFFGATLVSTLFIGLSKIQVAKWLFGLFTPSLQFLMQVGWYFLFMDIVMYFGDKVTWDYATREYGYYQALYETYMTRQQFKMSKDSSIHRMFQREAEIFASLPGNHLLAKQQRSQQAQEDPLNAASSVEHVPVFSEYQHVKHLYRTAQLQLSYMWFGILMAGMMDYAQLRTFMRFKGINVIPYRGLSHWIPQEVRAEFSGVEGKLDNRVNLYRGSLSHTDNLNQFRESLRQYVTERYETSPFPQQTSLGPRGAEAIRLSRAMTDLLRSMAWATSRWWGGWQDAARQIRTLLDVVLQDPDLVMSLRRGFGEHGAVVDELLAQARREAQALDPYSLSETTLDPVRLGSTGQPALSQVLSLLERQGQAVAFLQKLSDAIVTYMEAGRITPEHFVDQLTFHHAKWDIMVEHAEDAFRSFRKRRDALALQYPKPDRVSAEAYEEQLRVMVLEQTLLSTDWKTVDNEMEFQIIRYVFWNNSVVQFLKNHGMFWAGRGLRASGRGIRAMTWRLPGTLRMTGRQLQRIATALRSGIKSYSRVHYGESLEDAQERMLALMGAQMAHAMAKRRAFDIEGYIMKLRDMLPSLIESMEQQGDNLNLPPFMQQAIRDITQDYRRLQTFAGVTEEVEPGQVPGKLGALQRASDEDVEAMRGFFDLWSVGLLRQPEEEGPVAHMVRELSVPGMFRDMNAYEVDDFLSSVRDLALANGLSDDELRAALARVVGASPSELPRVMDAQTVPQVLGVWLKRFRTQRSRLDTQKLLAQLAVVVIRKADPSPLARYEALVKFKLSLVGKLDEMRSGQLSAGGRPIRVMMDEDMDWLKPHLAESELRNLAEGDLQYSQAYGMVEGKTAGGQAYRLYTGHGDEYDRFFGTELRATTWGVKRSFGAVGPYVFLRTDSGGVVQRLQDPRYWSQYQPRMLNLRTLQDNGPRPMNDQEAQQADWEAPDQE